MRQLLGSGNVFLLLALLSFYAACVSALANDCNLLWELYCATGGPQWSNQTGWSLGVDFVQSNCCVGLAGVSCSKEGRVVAIQLASANLVGQLPFSIGLLSHLETLDLSSNALNGSLPSSFSQLQNLTLLDLHSNQFEGNLPQSLAVLSQLQYLDLAHNHFKGGIPDSYRLMSSLRYLFLGENQLSGEVPPSIGQLTSLVSLYISRNRFLGQLPSSFSNLSALQDFYAEGNQLEGCALDILIMLSGLRSLNLQSNNIACAFPDKVETWQTLRLLDLSGNGISGIVPATIGSLTNLQYLDLSSNLLCGPVPAEIGLLIGLQYLDLSSNPCMTGEIPDTLSNLGNVWRLDLGFGNFSGQLRNQFQGMLMLTHLDLSSNGFEGDIPDSLCRSSPSISVLLLGSNRFTSFPNCSIPSVMVMDLSINSLVHFPFELIGEFKSLLSLDLSTNLFPRQDFPSALFQNAHSLRKLSLANNLFSGTFPIRPCAYMNQTMLFSLDLTATEVSAVDFESANHCSLCATSYPYLQTLRLPGVRLPNSWPGIPAYSIDVCGGIPVPAASICDFFTLFPSLTFLDLSNNNLSTNIDSLLQNVPLLRNLFLAGNQLHNSTSLGQASRSLLYFNPKSSYMYDAGTKCYEAEISGELKIGFDPSFFDFFNCQCIPGYFGKPPNCVSCQGVLQNAKCSVDAPQLEHISSVEESIQIWRGSGNVLADDGYWASPGIPYHDMMNNVAYPTVVELCRGAGTGETPCRSSKDGPCVAGYTGRLCSGCVEGFFRTGNLCLQCPRGFQLYLFAFFVFLLLFLIFVWSMFVGSSSSGTVKIVILFLQALFLVKVPMPANLAFVSDAGESSVVISLAGPECFFSGWSFRTSYLVSVLEPAAVIFLECVVWLAGNLLLRIRRPGEQAILAAWQDRCKRSAVFLLMFGYMGVTSSILIPMACEQDPGDGNFYFISMPDEVCRQSLTRASAILFVLYVVGLPAFFGLCLYRSGLLKSHQVESGNRSRYVLGFLFLSYTDKARYWEVINTVRRFLLALGFAAFRESSALQSLFLMVVICIALVLQALRKPYENHTENILELVALANLELNYVIGIKSKVLGVSDVTAVGTILFVSSALVITAGITLLLRNLLSQLKQKLGKRLKRRVSRCQWVEVPLLELTEIGEQNAEAAKQDTPGDS